jgi:hypothetical protein
MLGLQANEAKAGVAAMTADQNLRLERARLLADLAKHDHDSANEMAQHGVEQGVDMHKHAASLETDQAIARHAAEIAADAQVQAARSKPNGTDAG